MELGGHQKEGNIPDIDFHQDNDTTYYTMKELVICTTFKFGVGGEKHTISQTEIKHTHQLVAWPTTKEQTAKSVSKQIQYILSQTTTFD